MKKSLFICGLLALCAAALVARFISLVGYYEDTTPYGPIMCLKMPSSQAPEDTQVINGTRVVLMGTDDRLTMWETPGKGPKDAYKGGITAMKLPKDMTDYPMIYPIDPKNWPKEVDFHPFGLHILNETLYVINHAYAKGGERIEVFGIENIPSQLSLKYKRSIVLPESMMGITNDVVMLSDSEFFLTTWKSVPDDLEGRKTDTWTKVRVLAEWVFGLKWTYLYRCKDVNGTAECSVIDSGITMNSVTIRGKELYVSDTVAKVIKKYQITDVGADLVAEIPTKYPVDNIEYDPNSDLIYMGFLGRLWDYMTFIHQRHSGEAVETGIPGGCDELDPKTGKSRHILLQSKQSGVSSCARSGMFIVMGSWHETHVLVCPMEDPKKK